MPGTDSVHGDGRERSPGPDLVSTQAATHRPPNPGRPPKVQSGHLSSTASTKSRVNGATASDPTLARLLNLKAAANYLGVSPWTIRDLEARGVLKRVTVPLPSGTELRKLLFDKVDLDCLIEAWKA